MTAITVSREADRWQAHAGIEPVGALRQVVRPDQRRVLLFRDCHEMAYEPLLARALAALDGESELYLSLIDPREELLTWLSGHGFTPWRSEHRYRIPVELGRFPAIGPPPGIGLVSAADADLDQLRLLDDALREVIPGSAGWRWTPEEFREEVFSTGFDPATYLVAVAEPAGRYVGLIRVWLRPDGARVGSLGLLPEYRRTRVTAALVRTCAIAVHERGVRELSTEIDASNHASNRLARRAGAVRVGTLHHLVRPEPEARK